jgi:hypothetical protein
VGEKVTGEGNPDSWVDWRLGVVREIGGFELDLSYTDTNGDGERIYGEWAEPRLVLSLSKSF